MALLSVEEALARVLADVAPLAPERVPLLEAHGRVLADDLAALRTQPPAAVSAMDGYAVRGADVGTVPATLTLIGEVAAGRPFSGCVGAGQAVRIFTGGVMPAGADAVVVQENVRRDGSSIVVTVPTRPGRHVRAEGLDFRAGDILLRKGARIGSRHLALAAAMNHASIPVHRRPRVGVLATGDELVPPGGDPAPGQIVYSNGFALIAMLRREGAEVVDFGIVPDRHDITVAALAQARDQGLDILVTAGGASVGDYDLVQPALMELGMQLSFWRVALRPGRPLLHGRLGSMRVLGLPGNPVSAYVSALLFLMPLVRALAGRTDLGPTIEPAILGVDLGANDERAEYLRARLSERAGHPPVVTPFEIQDSSLGANLAAADCLLVRPPRAPAAQAGQSCSIIKLGL